MKSVLPTLLILAAVRAHAADPTDIGTRRELFVDDALIESVSGGARLVLHHPEPREIALDHDAPWEGTGSGYHSVFRDGDKYRMYYKAWHLDVKDGKVNTGSHPLYCCYAESDDGIHWRKPELGLVDFKGSKANNIVLAPETFGEVKSDPGHPAVFRDDNPACPPEARYKAIIRAAKPLGLLVFQSPDGLHWSLAHPEPVITEGAFDSQNLAFWDTDRGEYRAYWRYFGDGVRAIRTATSKDFINWENEADLTYTEGTPNEHLYTNAIQKYFRAPQLFIGFPTRFEPKSQQVEPVLMTSRDGTKFHRYAEAVVPRTAPKDRNHNRSNYMAWGMFQLPGKPNEISVYATENYYEPSPGRVRRFVYRIDGFVALRGGVDGGRVTTKPLRYQGGRLLVNYVVRGGGTLSIEALNEQGGVIGKSQPLSGDAIDAPVAWTQDPKFSEGVVQLRFTLKDADVFSIRFD